MLEKALSFIKEHGKPLEDQMKFVLSVDWSSESSSKKKAINYKFASDIVNSALKKLEFVINEAGEDFRRSKRVQAFTSKIVNFANSFVENCRIYLDSEDWKLYEQLNDDEDPEKLMQRRLDEIAFQDDILSNIIKVNEIIKKIRVDESNEDFHVPIFGKNILCIAQYEQILRNYEGLENFLELKKQKENENLTSGDLLE